jgi:hypothetical protein
MMLNVGGTRAKACPQSCKQWRHQLPGNIYPSKARPGDASLKHYTTRLAKIRKIFAPCPVFGTPVRDQ